MFARWLWLVLLLVSCGGAASISRRVPDAAPRVGDPALAAGLERIRTDLALPGAAALVIEDAHVGASAAVGFRALPSRAPLALSDRFHLGSDGKAMTATLAAVLMREGRLPGWDTPLSVVFPDMTIDPAFRDVTLRELAAHRGGLPRDPEVDDAERAAILAIADPVAQREAIVARELARAPAHPRGERSYSNVGFVMLGRAIERAGGAPFEELMRTRLFEPLAMSSCGFAIPEGEGGYGHRGDGALADASTVIPPSYAPAGGVHCALEDWARFVIEHLRGERGEGVLLDADAYRTLHGGDAYAFGWNLQTTAHGRRLAHAGSNGFWMALVRVELDTGRAVLFATNVGEVDLDRLEPMVDALGGVASP